MLMLIQNFLVHDSSFLLSLSLAHPAEAMLIQADWFQPDAPELAPGVAVMQVDRGVHGWCMTAICKCFLFCLRSLVEVCSVPAFANAHINTNRWYVHIVCSMHKCISRVNHKPRNSLKSDTRKTAGCKKWHKHSLTPLLASDRWRRGGCNRSIWRWQMEGQSDDGELGCTVMFFGLILWLLSLNGRQPRLREMVPFTAM